MAFDREAAKTAGYSEAEINAYLAQNPDTTSAAPTQRSMSSQMLNAIPALALGAGLTGADVIGQSISRQATSGAMGRLLPELLKLGGKQLPGVHTVRDVKDFVSNVAGTGGPPPPIAAASEATNVARGPVTVTQEMIDRLPLLKHFNVGDAIDPKDLNRIRIKSAEAEMRTAPRGKPNLKLVPPSEAGPASLESTVTPEAMTAPSPPAPSRHEIEYYSKGQKKFVPIESMSNQDLLAAKDELAARKPSMGKAPVTKTQLDAVNAEIATRVQGTPEVPGGHYLSESRGIVPINEMHISHMRNAMNKAWARLQKNPTDPSLQRQFNDVKNEVTLRAQQAGELTVPSEVPAVARNFRPSAALGEGIGGLNEVAMILGMLHAPQQMAETDALMNQVRQQEAQRNQTSPALLRALFGNQSQGY